jgi:AcrR family transcriptional regulator
MKHHGNSAMERRDAEGQRRREFVTAALDVVHEHGLIGLTMRRLANQMGLSPMTMYRYFDSKADLYRAMVDRAWNEALDEIHRAPPAPPRERIVRMLLVLRRVLLAQGEAAILAASAHPPTEARQCLRAEADDAYRALGFVERDLPVVRRLLGQTLLSSAVFEASTSMVARVTSERETRPNESEADFERRVRILLETLILDAGLTDATD